ncbi:flagellar export chaperone FlgN [Celerinatantimonas diazotrophica]|uniref:Flagellar biosynthesis/type III secretory pathway chaperone n=1 Tax=Celerinatantimonas diazotrophica TaxID=412034 RepID=A0A4R1JNT1_9GAMM|nr:flagellar export chaperone FlgN [Celerinatantimonas diazotrophica]TCK52179.1 flagellar biosynthesis/type III secretory pathway chaperone [Celerinatantimonas diazotrophica]CAG9296116.1 hypothetical protein CEDIAZO_01259 [Celerinatantimonas diazotrophica]
MLESLLTQQQQLLEKLMQALQEEQQVLAERNIDGINAIAQQKNILLEQLNENDHLIEAHPKRQLLTSEPQLIAKRKQLTKMLSVCQQANTINGRIIKASSEEVEKLAHQMNHLMQQTSMTYDKAGRQHTASRHGKSFKA